MAHIKVLLNATSLVRVVYLVDAVVGRGGANRADDVFLVQFLLNALWGRTIDGRVMGGGPAPAVDGICGARTIEAIYTFQQYYWGDAQVENTDGRVEPLPSNSPLGPRHQNPYSIIGLNTNYGTVFGMDRHLLLPAQPGFPPSLKPKLMVTN